MEELTAEQKETYLSCRGARCPACCSNDIEGDDVQFDDYTDEATEKVRCLDCGAEWLDTLQIVNVQLTKESDKK